MDEFATLLVLSSFFAVLLMMPWKFTGFFVLFCFYSSLFFVFFVCCTQELYFDCIQSRDVSAISFSSFLLSQTQGHGEPVAHSHNNLATE